MTYDTIMTAEQIGAFFGVSKKTVWEWCKTGKIPAFKIGKEWRVRQSDLQRLITQKLRSDRHDTLFYS